MKRLFLMLALTAIAAWDTGAGPVLAQDGPPVSPPPEQQPAPQPQPQQPQQPQQQSPQNDQATSAAGEAQIKREEAQRRKALQDMFGLLLDDAKQSVPPQITEPCLTQSMRARPDVHLSPVSLEDWRSVNERTQIPWTVEIGKPELRMDQRHEVSYSVRVQGKDLKGPGADHEVVFASGIAGPDGQWLTTPMAVGQIFGKERLARSQIRFSDCVFMRPGDYVLWLALYDAATNLQNIVKRRIRVPELRDNLLPNLNANQPRAEFPPIIRTDMNSVQTVSGALFLPVSNKQPVRVELISVVTPPDQWADRIDIIRSHNNRVLAAVGALSQMRLANGSISAKALDLISGQVPFEQENVLQLNWLGLAGAFTRIVDSQKVSTSALQSAKDRSGFFRDSLQQHLNTPSEPLRVVIVISSSLVFERGSNLDPLKVTGDCRCRVYHIRFRLNKADLFDDLDKLMKPLRPKTFDIASAMDLRRAMAAIVQDLESL